MRDSGMKFHAKSEGKWLLSQVNFKVKVISKKRWFSGDNFGRVFNPGGVGGLL